MCAALFGAGLGPARLSCKLEVSGAAFGKWCELAFRWGRAAMACCIVDELAWVTNPGKAPQGWLELVTGGLKYGIDLVSITQRPSESDKTALSQSTTMVSFVQDRVADVKYMAAELRCEAEQIDGLARLQYIERDKATRTNTVKQLSFGRGPRPKA